MEHIKTFEAFDNYYDGYEDLQINEGRIKDGIDYLKKGVEKGLGKLVGEISIEDAKEIAEERYASQIKNAKKFDSNPENVKRAKEIQGDDYLSAEDSIYYAVSVRKDGKPIVWDSNLAKFRNQSNFGAKSFGGGIATGGGSK